MCASQLFIVVITIAILANLGSYILWLHLHSTCPHHLSNLTNAKIMLFLKDLTVTMKDLIYLSLNLTTRAFEKSPIYDRFKPSNLLLGKNEHHTADKPREARRFDNYWESTHVDYERVRDKADAIHNWFKGRSRNANVSCSDITQKVWVDVPTYDGKINAPLFLIG